MMPTMFWSFLVEVHEVNTFKANNIYCVQHDTMYYNLYSI